MTYAEKLRDPRWQKKRLKILEANGWRCESCGSRDKSLEIHHCFYIRVLEPWQYGPDLLMVLCSDCHKHRQQREEAIHVALARIMRNMRHDDLEAAVWPMLEIVLREANERSEDYAEAFQ